MPICGCLLKWRQSGGNESLTCGVKVLPREPLTRDSIRIGLSHIAGVVELVGVGEKKMHVGRMKVIQIRGNS